MKKAFSIAHCLILMFRLPASATPLQDYSQGRVTVDVNGASSKLRMVSSSCSTSTNNYNKKTYL